MTDNVWVVDSFRVQAVLKIVDADGETVRKVATDPVELGGVKKLADYVDRFPAELVKFNAAQQEAQPVNGNAPNRATRRAAARAKP